MNKSERYYYRTAAFRRVKELTEQGFNAYVRRGIGCYFVEWQ